MTLLSYGPPFGGIMQIAYTVEDIDKAMDLYGKQFGIGPWIVRRLQPKRRNTGASRRQST